MSQLAGLRSESHDLADARRAIREVSLADGVRLHKASISLIRGFHIDQVPNDHEDLLSEAITRTLAGERRWRQGVDFVHHLIQVMRSVASDWRRRYVRRDQEGAGEQRVADLLAPVKQGEGEPPDPFGNPASRERDQQARMIAAAEVEAIKRQFAHDPEVARVIACLEMNMNNQQMREHTGMSQRQLVTAKQRMRRQATRWRDSHGQ